MKGITHLFYGCLWDAFFQRNREKKVNSFRGLSSLIDPKDSDPKASPLFLLSFCHWIYFP